MSCLHMVIVNLIFGNTHGRFRLIRMIGNILEIPALSGVTTLEQSYIIILNILHW